MLAETFFVQPLSEEEVAWYDLEKTIKYIPYETVVEKLNTLCKYEWSCINFQHFFFTMPDGRIKISGSLDVVINYHVDLDNPSSRKISRTLSGASTFYSEKFTENEHWAATCKSLSIINAVQVLGIAFGWGLNDPARINVTMNKFANTLTSLHT